LQRAACSTSEAAPAGDLLQAASKQRERSAQGQTAAWLRIAREVEVQLPAGSRASVAAGEPVWAGRTALARFQRDGD
jgi:hypothetical protein